VTHVIHPREEWIDPAGPPWDGFPAAGGGKYRCPPFPGWSKITDVVIHYPGADWADMDFDNDLDIDLDDDVEQIRAQHRMYVTSPTRGYSLGYCFLIGQTGGIWESRGWRNVNAANKGQASMGTTGWNGYSISIQLIVDEANAATPAQVDSVNWLLDELVRVSGKQLRLRYHGQGQATSCCGAGIIAQIKAGTINFGKSQPQPIPKPPPPGEDEMATTVFKPFDCAAQFVGQTDKNGVATTVWWCDKQRADAHIAAGAREDASLSLGGFQNVVLLGPLPTGDDKHQWTGAEFFRVVS